MKKSTSEIEEVVERLHLGIHSGDGSGINRLHWIGFIDFIIKNPQTPKKLLTHQLISVLCVKERTVLEYINCAIAWDVLRYENGILHYNKTYNNKKEKKTKTKKDNIIKDSNGKQIYPEE
jgi:hypothetical protein